MFILNHKLAMGTSLSSEEETLWEAEAEEDNAVPVESDPRRDPVYECCDTALWGKRLVLTPYMLLDRLQVCAELAKEAQESTPLTGAVAERMDRISEEVNHLLRLLERGGLWTDTHFVNKKACDGQVYRVLSEPFVAEA